MSFNQIKVIDVITHIELGDVLVLDHQAFDTGDVAIIYEDGELIKKGEVKLTSPAFRVKSHQVAYFQKYEVTLGEIKAGDVLTFDSGDKDPENNFDDPFGPLFGEIIFNEADDLVEELVSVENEKY